MRIKHKGFTWKKWVRPVISTEEMVFVCYGVNLKKMKWDKWYEFGGKKYKSYPTKAVNKYKNGN